jgi:glutathione synthase/RimK-type ligase-like ATP-grasp enzyme
VSVRRIALVTAAQAAALDEDLPPLLSAFKAAGARAEPAVWDDPAVEWGSFDLALVRSAWDYASRRGEFLAWAERVERLANPAPLLRWCTDKRYLLDLASAGVPAVPTRFFEPGAPVEIPFEGNVVVKPAVGAGSMDAALHFDRGAARAHSERLTASGRAAMVQPYLRGVETRGETGLIYFGDRYSHSIRKGAMLGPRKEVVGGLFLREEISAREPARDERAVAEAALDTVPGGRERLWYARVDVAPGPDGRPLLLEFEAAEPSLFFAFAPGSAAAFAATVLSRLE